MYSIEIIQCPKCKQTKKVQFDCNEDLPSPQIYKCDKCGYKGEKNSMIDVRERREDIFTLIAGAVCGLIIAGIIVILYLITICYHT